MVADISQASTLPVGPTRFAARIVWLPAPQARSRTRMPGRTPAISMSVSVADDSPAENSRSHFAQPGAAFSQVLRSSDFEALSAISESCFSGCIAKIWLPFDVWNQSVALTHHVSPYLLCVDGGCDMLAL